MARLRERAKTDALHEGAISAKAITKRIRRPKWVLKYEDEENTNESVWKIEKIWI